MLYIYIYTFEFKIFFDQLVKQNLTLYKNRNNLILQGCTIFELVFNISLLLVSMYYILY